MCITEVKSRIRITEYDSISVHIRILYDIFKAELFFMLMTESRKNISNATHPAIRHRYSILVDSDIEPPYITASL